MKQKVFSILTMVLMPSLFFAQTSEGSISNSINAIFEPIVENMSKVIFYKPFSFIGLDIPLVVLWLVLGAVFFTIYMKFINVKGFFHAIQLVRGKYDDPEDKGEVSHFQALVTALSGTVGLGNIAGVAVAIQVGGPGAIFWMWVTAIFGIATKFFTCTLSVMYREVDPNGDTRAGPMYVVKNGLPKYMFPLAYFFAFFGMIGCLADFQSNQIVQIKKDLYF